MNRPPRGLLATLILLALALGLGGCRAIEKTAELPSRAVSAVRPGRNPAAPDPAALQAALQHYADDFRARMAAALDEYARLGGNPEIRAEALGWKVSLGSAVVSLASGPNPNANLLDLVTLATLTRAVFEERALAEPRNALASSLEASRAVETNAWRLAETVLTPEQVHELRAAVEQWRRDNTGTAGAFFARPQEFAVVVRESAATRRASGSVFSLVGLDPMAGLDPAVREVTQTRLFAERALFVMQRMPTLVRWHMDLMTEQFFQRRQIADAVESADRLSRAVESASQTAARLPEQLATERQAILDALEAQEGKLRELSAEAGRTLAAGEKMAGTLNTTLITFDALMKRFGVGEPGRPPPGTNSAPFNILDYAHTAERVTSMARELDAVIRGAGSTLDSPALDRRIAELRELPARARADARAVLNHAFLLGAGLIGLAFVCALVYRRIGRGAPGNPAP